MVKEKQYERGAYAWAIKLLRKQKGRGKREEGKKSEKEGRG